MFGAVALNPSDNSDQSVAAVLTLADIKIERLISLLQRFNLTLEVVDRFQPIPGSYWGEPEAGIIGTFIYARMDTPIHSILHEACHLIVMPPEKRITTHTNASDSIEEENATCYLQIVLAGHLPDVGKARLMADMDAWGYTYRLGSTKAWFESDAEDARRWLEQAKLLPASQ